MNFIYTMTGYMLMRTKNTKTITRYMIEYQTYCSIKYQYICQFMDLGLVYCGRQFAYHPTFQGEA